MKKTLLLLLFLLAYGFAEMSASYDMLQVSLNDETTVEIVISDDLQISFNKNDLIAKASQTNITIPKSAILNISHVNTNSIENLYDNMDFEFKNGLIFHNLPSGSIITIYDMEGKIEESTTAEGDHTISIDNLLPGAYIVRVNNKSYKIFKK